MFTYSAILTGNVLSGWAKARSKGFKERGGEQCGECIREEDCPRQDRKGDAVVINIPLSHCLHTATVCCL